MAPLNQSEVDNLVTELAPKTVSEDQMINLGVGAYKALFDARPEFKKYFRRLRHAEGNIYTSEPMRLYGKEFMEGFMKMICNGANDQVLQKMIKHRNEDYSADHISPEELKVGEPIFVNYFTGIVSRPENKRTMEKFITRMFSEITAHM